MEIQAPWPLQRVKEFALHKPQVKSLCADTLFQGFVSMGPKSSCVLLQGEALIPWESSSSPSLSSLRPLDLLLALNPVIFGWMRNLAPCKAERSSRVCSHGVCPYTYPKAADLLMIPGSRFVLDVWEAPSPHESCRALKMSPGKAEQPCFLQQDSSSRHGPPGNTQL